MGVDAEKVLNEAEDEDQHVYNHIRDAAEWFHEREGEMFKTEEAQKGLSEGLDITVDLANQLINELVEDSIDPVVQVNTSKGRYVGIIEYKEFEGAYGYENYDDIKGKTKKVVCARCVEKAAIDSEVTQAISEDSKTEYDQLLGKIKNHYSSMHDTQPTAVKTGATLAAGTTVGGNRVATRNWVRNNF